MSFLNVFFKLNDQKTIVQAKSDDLFAEVVLRYFQLIDPIEEEKVKFLFNSEILNPQSGKTLAEYGIKNGSSIDVILTAQIIGGPPKIVGPILTITFRKDKEAYCIIQAGSYNLLGEYFKYMACICFRNKIHFFYNSSELKDKDKTLADYKIVDKSIIDMEECDPEHCKICCKNLISKIKKEKKELENQLNKEKDKNKDLLKENDNLKQKLENLNKENKEIKELVKNLNNNKQAEYIITSINPGEKILAVNFVNMGNQDIGHYNLKCKNSDLFVSLEERLYKDFPQFKNYNTYFVVNGKNIKRFKTMDENGIKNNDVISIFINED